MSKKKPAKKQLKKPQKQKPKQKPKQKTVLKPKQKKLKTKKKITLTGPEKQKAAKIKSKLSNLYRSRKNIINELDNYIFTNPNKKILTNIGNKDKNKFTNKKISTIINFLSNKITGLNTKINSLNAKKSTIKKKKAKLLAKENKLNEVEKEQKFETEEKPIEAPIEVNAWERKEIFKKINYKFVKNVINGQTGEIFNKEEDTPGLINKINEELRSMSNYDLFRLTVYKDFIVYEILLNGFIHENNPENKPKPKNKK